MVPLYESGVLFLFMKSLEWILWPCLKVKVVVHVEETVAREKVYLSNR